MATIKFTLALASAALLVACGASMPPPTQRMADAQAAQRAARELGAAQQPSAQLHLKLAEEETAKAQTLMSRGDNAEASSLLARAKADSELAVALAREQQAANDLQQVSNQANANTNAIQGARQ